MVFTTLQYNGIERPLADWPVYSCKRHEKNQAQDNITLEVPMAADGNDPFPYDAQVTLRIQRSPTAGTGTDAGGSPLAGITQFKGGSIEFVGYRTKNKRVLRSNQEFLSYTFVGIWERFLDRTVFQKLQASYNGINKAADWLDEVVLGQSLNALIGVNDTVTGTTTTNLMSLTQQIKEIVAWALTQATALKGSAPFQFTGLTANGAGDYLLYATPQDTLLLPDFIPGYGGSGWDSGSSGTGANGVANYLPFGPGNVNVALRAPLDTVKRSTCSECLRNQFKWVGPIGDVSAWFDNTKTPPKLNVGSRDQLPTVTLPYPNPNPNLNLNLVGPKGPMNPGVSDITRLDELIPPAIDLKFLITSTINGVQQRQTIHDIAAVIGGNVVEGIGLAGALYTAASALTASPTLMDPTTMALLESLATQPDAVTDTINMQGVSGTVTQCGFKTIAVDTSTSPASNAMLQNLFPDLAEMTNLAFASGAPSLTLIDEDAGGSVNTSTFAYCIIGNTAAPWMSSGGTACQTKRAKLTFAISGDKNVKNGSTSVFVKRLTNEVRHATITLCTIPGATYTNSTITALAEIIPFGLAGYCLNIARIPHFEGSYTIHEQEITRQCPMGVNVNLSGGRAEWATMRAQVQEIETDYDTATTVIHFGPGKHLGPADLAQRLKFNRGPRWMNLFASSILGAGSNQQTQFGTDVAGKSPIAGGDASSIRVDPSDLSDTNTYPDAVPGITHDNRLSGQPGYGGGYAPNGPASIWAIGSGGALTSWATIQANGLVKVSKTAAGITTTAQLDQTGALTLQNGTKTILASLAGPGGHGTISVSIVAGSVTTTVEMDDTGHFLISNGSKSIQLALADIPTGFPPSGISSELSINEWETPDSSCNPRYALFLSSKPYPTALTGTPL